MVEVHAFLCTIAPRTPSYDTPSLEVSFVMGEQFCHVEMGGLASQQQLYQVRCSSRKVGVVNGQDYHYDQVGNPTLVLQLL